MHPVRDAPPTNQLRIQRILRRVLKFTACEETLLKEGIDKHRFRQWTAILRDPGDTFQDGRTADSLKKRGHTPDLNTSQNAEMGFIFGISATQKDNPAFALN